jgi:hypothetical protein
MGKQYPRRGSFSGFGTQKNAGLADIKRKKSARFAVSVNQRPPKELSGYFTSGKQFHLK